MTRIEAPTRPGYYAFRGTRRNGNNHLVSIADLVRVVPAPYGRTGLAVQTRTNMAHPLSSFNGEWWLVTLPWDAVP